MLSILALTGVLLAGFFYYIFRQSSKLTGNLPSTAKTHNKLSTALNTFKEGRHRESLKQLTGVIQDFERSGNIAGIVAATTLTGHALEKLGEYEDAARAYKSTMSVAHREEYRDSLEIAYRRYCFCQLQLGDPVEAGNALRKLSEVYRRKGHHENAVLILLRLANTLRWHGHLEEARIAYGDALALGTRYENPQARAMALHDQALFLRTMGRMTEALACAEEAAEIRMAGSDLAPRAHMQCTLTDILRQLGRIEDARVNYRLALEAASNAGSQRFVGIAELEGSLIAWAGGQRDEAWTALRRAMQAAAADDKSEDRRPVNAIIEASYAERSGNSPEALLVLGSVANQFPTMKPHVRSAFFNVKCRALAKNGQPEEAAAELEKSSALSAKLKAPLYLAENALSAGVVALFSGDYEQAVSRLQEALDFFRSGGFSRETATTQRYRAAALAALGRSSESAVAKEEAARIYLKLGDRVSAAEI